jgi:hypothetical protein
LLESSKIELQFGLNSFDTPAENSGIKAWVRLISQLCFIVPGSYQSVPAMGIGIQNYDFSMIDNIQDDLEDKITEQVRTYLPDIPFDSVEIRRLSDTYPDVLLILFNFTYDDKIETAVVAAQTNSVNGINFEIVV